MDFKTFRIKCQSTKCQHFLNWINHTKTEWWTKEWWTSSTQTSWWRISTPNYSIKWGASKTNQICSCFLGCNRCHRISPPIPIWTKECRWISKLCNRYTSRGILNLLISQRRICKQRNKWETSKTSQSEKDSPRKITMPWMRMMILMKKIFPMIAMMVKITMKSTSPRTASRRIRSRRSQSLLRNPPRDLLEGWSSLMKVRIMAS